MQATGLDSGGADAVLLCNALHVATEPELALDEAVRLARPGAPIILTWPLDSVSNDQLLRLELGLGRSWLRAFAADQSRRVIALVARVMRTPRVNDAQLDTIARSATDRHGLRRSSDEVLMGCQRIVVLTQRAAE